LITCQSCAASESCGWCTDCGKCTEGGTTGPSSTNCMAWDYDQCSGSDKFADLMLDAHQEELSRREKLIAQYDAERDNYVQAQQEVSAMEQVAVATSDMTTMSKSVETNDESGTNALSTDKDTTATKCNTLTEELSAAKQEFGKTEAKLKEQETILRKLEDDKTVAMEGGADDTSQIDETLRETKELMATTQSQVDQNTAKKTSLENDAKSACDAASEAAAKQAQHDGVLLKAEAGAKGAAGMVGAVKTALALKKKEATRAKTQALSVAAQIKAITKELVALRNSRTAANPAHCKVTEAQQEQAKRSITEFEECVDCQGKK
jgi:hypothetical protein